MCLLNQIFLGGIGINRRRKMMTQFV